MKEQSPAVLQSACDKPESGASKPYTSLSYGESGVDVESVFSGVVLIGMMGFICMLFIGCFDAGLFA